VIVHDIAVQLRETRYALGMTQVELAAVLLVAPSTIATWESDRQAPPLGYRQWIARELRAMKASGKPKWNPRLRSGRKPGPKNIWSKLPAPKCAGKGVASPTDHYSEG
jgi:transcriptional regulator with XRE-family HTH domain